MQELQIGRVYRHFKGDYYLVEGLAHDSESGVPCVIYRKLYGDGGLWVRPLEMFLSRVDREKYPEVRQEYRFQLQEIASVAHHKALKYAVKMDLIPFNPADKVERPKKQRYIADYYRQEELERLLEASKDHPYSLLIQMTAFYGLRRSEALGLKWDAIDFERDTITIKHIVTNAKIDGKCEIVCADRAKTKSSLRSLPLVSNIREKLLALREQQKEDRRVCGNCYSKKYDGYVFVDAMGNIFNPRSVTANFSKLLEQNGLRHIRFHDLRHSCASLLLANGVPLKHIQEWLGHSDFTTTANIYAHLDYKSKITSAQAMETGLSLPEGGDFSSRWGSIGAGENF